MNQDELEYLRTEDHFSSFDLGLASSLVALGYEVAGIDKQNPRKAQFVFKKWHEVNGNIEEDIKKYWDGKLLVDARHLVDSMKMLKNRLYSS